MKERDNKFDTLKGFLIILVVFGHLLGQRVFFTEGNMPVYNAIYVGIFSFHMPAIILISGYFSKRPVDSPQSFRKLVLSYLIPYVIFDLLHWLITSREFTALLYPHYTMWYLLCLFFWKLLLPVIASFRFPLALSLALALFAGLTKAETFLSASRALAFFPFFVAGYYLRPEQVRKLRSLPKIVPALILLLSLGLAILLYRLGVTQKIFHMKVPYEKLSLSPWKALSLRALVLLLGFSSSLSLIALVPSRKTPLTGLGTRTITVYLFHSLTIKVLILLGVSAQVRSEALVLLIDAALTALICLLFGNRFVAKCYQAAMQGIGRILLKKSE